MQLHCTTRRRSIPDQGSLGAGGLTLIWRLGREMWLEPTPARGHESDERGGVVPKAGGQGFEARRRLTCRQRGQGGAGCAWRTVGGGRHSGRRGYSIRRQIWASCQLLLSRELNRIRVLRRGRFAAGRPRLELSRGRRLGTTGVVVVAVEDSGLSSEVGCSRVGRPPAPLVTDDATSDAMDSDWDGRSR